MDKGEKIFQTFDNITKIYNEVNQLLNIIDESFKNLKINGKALIGQKSKKVTWDTSSAMDVTNKWANRFFVRYYRQDTRKRTKKAIGICIWLYGDPELEVLFQRPYISCSVVEFESAEDNSLGEWFRNAGHYEGYSFEADEAHDFLYISEYCEGDKLFDKMKTYFVDLVQVTNTDKVHEYIIEPCIQLFEGNLDKLEKKQAFLKIDDN